MITNNKEKVEKESTGQTDTVKDDRDILELLNEALAKGDMSDFSEYTQNTQAFANMPDNQFGHAWGLINIRRGEVKGFEDLLNPHIFLGNVEDAKSLKLYQLDFYWLINLYRLAAEDPALKYVFEPLWTSFLGELRLTGALEGSERIYQAFKVPGYKSKGFSILKKKKKKEPLDYVFPDDEDDGIY